MLTSENRDLLRDSVSTLSKTLKHVEVSLLFSNRHLQIVWFKFVLHSIFSSHHYA